jgi:hypothetical protein
MMVAFGIFAMAALGVVSISVSSLKLMSQTTMQTYTDTDVNFAFQYLLGDIRQAEAFNIQTTNATNDTLVLTFPIITASGWYDRNTLDVNNPATYYLSDSTGTLGRTGTYLWKSQGGNLTLIRKDICQMQFTKESASSIQVTVSAAPWDYYTKSAKSQASWSTLSSRTAFMRNY